MDLSLPQKKAVEALKGVVYLTAIEMKLVTVGSPPYSNGFSFISVSTSSLYPSIISHAVQWTQNPLKPSWIARYLTYFKKSGFKRPKISFSGSSRPRYRSDTILRFVR